MIDDTEVKGLWFASTRAYLLRAGGAEMVEQIADRMDRHRAALDDPIVGAWYPEAVLHEMLEALWDQVGRDRDAFVEHTTGATGEGVGKFFRILIALGSPGFVLRKVPVMWSRLRRGDRAIIEVVASDDFSTLHYQRFPWFRHEVYQLMTLASLRGLVQMSTGRLPRAEILHAGPEDLRVRVHYRDVEGVGPTERGTSGPGV